MVATLNRIRASDVTGQKHVDVLNVPGDASIGELLEGVMAELSLPSNDVDGHSIVYQARHTREGRQIHTSELIGEALREDDEISLTPNIDAGAPA